MARAYSKLASTLWTGETGKDIRQHPEGGAKALLVAAYLVSAPGSNMLGLYYQPIMYLAQETGLTFEEALKGLQVCASVGYCAYDPQTEHVWVLKMAEHQLSAPLKPGDHRAKGAQRLYDTLPDNPFLGPFFDHYCGLLRMTHRRDYKGAAKPLAKPLQTLLPPPQEDHPPETDLLGSPLLPGPRARTRGRTPSDGPRAHAGAREPLRSQFPQEKPPQTDSPQEAPGGPLRAPVRPARAEEQEQEQEYKDKAEGNVVLLGRSGNPSPPPPAEKVPAKRAKKAAVALPDGWTPAAEDAEVLATYLQVPVDAITGVGVEMFRDYAKTGIVQSDWAAKFRNFIRGNWQGCHTAIRRVAKAGRPEPEPPRRLVR